jgi:hypothetical protein
MTTRLSPRLALRLKSRKNGAEMTQLAWYTMIQNPTTGLVLDVAGGNFHPAAQIVANTPTGAASQMFRIGNGFIVSMLNGLVLALASSTATANVQVICWVPPVGGLTTAGPWKYANEQLEVSPHNLVLDIAGSKAGSAVVVNPASTAATQKWVMTPPRPLDAILAQASVPFPTFTGDEGKAYSSICTSLEFDVRDAYNNKNKDMGTLREAIKDLHCPSSIPHDPWSAVVKQLKSEIGMVADVRLVYANLDEWYSGIYLDQGHRLNTIIADAQIPTSSTFQVDPFSFLSGMLYTVISATGPAGGVLANLMITGLNVANAAQSIDHTFSATVSNLWNALSPAFTAGNTALAQNLDAILKDWGKLQAVEKLITSTGPDSLDLTATDEALLAQKAGQAYGATVLQKLMPLKWQIYKWSQTSNKTPYTGLLGTVPSYAQWVQPIGNGLANVYVISGGRGSFPSQQCMQNDIWNAGVTTLDFFTNSAKWPFTTTEYNLVDGETLVTTINNISGTAFTVAASIPNAQGHLWGSTTRTLPAWGGQLSFVSAYANGNEVRFTLTPQGKTTSVAQFDVHQKYAIAIGATPWVDPPTVSSPFTLSTPVIANSKIGQGGHPGTIAITIGPLGAV